MGEDDGAGDQSLRAAGVARTGSTRAACFHLPTPVRPSNPGPPRSAPARRTLVGASPWEDPRRVVPYRQGNLYMACRFIRSLMFVETRRRMKPPKSEMKNGK